MECSLQRWDRWRVPTPRGEKGRKKRGGFGLSALCCYWRGRSKATTNLQAGMEWLRSQGMVEQIHGDCTVDEGSDEKGLKFYPHGGLRA